LESIQCESKISGVDFKDILPGDDIDMYIRKGKLAILLEQERRKTTKAMPSKKSWTTPLKSLFVGSARSETTDRGGDDSQGLGLGVKSVDDMEAGSGRDSIRSGIEIDKSISTKREGAKSDGKEETAKVKRSIVSYFMTLVLAVINFVTFERWVSRRNLKQIRKSLYYAISAYMCAALTAMILSAYLVSSVTIYNVAVYVHLWTGVVVLLVSVMMIAINLAAYVGCYYQNRALLMMYAGVLITGMVMFLVVAIASFLYGSALAFYRHGDQYSGLADALPDEATAKLVRQYDLGLGGGCIIGFVLAVIPLRLACTMVCRLGKVQEKKVHPRQLRVVLRVAQAISLCAALVMLAYGGSSLNHLISINFAPTVFAIFGLIYCGVTVLLTAVTGLWVAGTAHKDVVYYYYMVVLPLLTMLLLAASGMNTYMHTKSFT
jgi:hypothetical protein